MSKHLRVAAAIAATTLVVGCSHVAQAPTAAPKSTGGGVATRTIIHQPGEASTPAASQDKDAAESLWGGTIGGRSANINLSFGSMVSASLPDADFNGNVLSSSVSGTLRKTGHSPRSVHLSGFGQSMSGYVGNDYANCNVWNGWVTGRVGNKNINLRVDRNSVSGDMNLNSVWLTGTGVQQNEGAGMTAALIVLTAATN